MSTLNLKFVADSFVMAGKYLSGLDLNQGKELSVFNGV